jgi:5'-phosphate synthase pdxT subunit
MLRRAQHKPTPFQSNLHSRLPAAPGIQKDEAARGQDTVVAPSRALADGVDVRKIKDARVEVLARLPGRTAALREEARELLDVEAGDIVAVRQANVFGTSFHPELSGDPRIHIWWLGEVVKAVGEAGDR